MLSIVSGVVVKRSIPSVDGTPNVYHIIPGFVSREDSAVLRLRSRACLWYVLICCEEIWIEIMLLLGLRLWFRIHKLFIMILTEYLRYLWSFLCLGAEATSR